MSDLLVRIAESLSGSKSLESLTRPLLELLERVTGFESTYVTTIDEAAGTQHVRFARNSGALHIPEGLDVPWGDSLCKRAIEQDVPYTDDVPGRWGESRAARELGITTFTTTPVRGRDGELLGTLCAASRDRRPLAGEAKAMFELFSTIIGQQIEREALLRRLEAANEELSAHATTDALTGLPNRRALREALTATLQDAYPDKRTMHLGFVDLDGFKAINDRHGHDTGDQFLVAFAARLRAALRPGDRVGRWGGDEFLVLFESRTDDGLHPEALGDRLERQLRGTYALSGTAIEYAGASVGVAASTPGETDIDALIARADAAMYARKRARKGG